MAKTCHSLTPFFDQKSTFFDQKCHFGVLIERRERMMENDGKKAQTKKNTIPLFLTQHGITCNGRYPYVGAQITAD